MDEFNIDDIFTNGTDSVPLEEKPEEVSAPESVIEAAETAESPEAVFEAPEAEQTSEGFTTETGYESTPSFVFTDPIFEDVTSQAGAYEAKEAQHTDTEAAAPEEPEAPDISVGQPHTVNSNPYAQQQNPYRNPYYQQHQSSYSNSYNNGYGSYYHEPQKQPGYYSNGYQEPKKPTGGSSKGKKLLAVLLVAVMIIGSIGIGISIGNSKSKPSGTPSAMPGANNSTTSDNATITIEPTKEQPVQSVDSVSPGIAVAKKARGSVVGVVVYDTNGTLYGEGSGVVMGLNDAKNLTYIITCAHVISDKAIKSCGIMLSDGTIYSAQIVGFDERTDIGVLSVKETNLEAATFGDSTTLQVGETVYAIGNPGGSEFYGSMTSGIVSALDRSISSTYTMTVIQHNAAISPGNSGGALVNSNGQVIGINSSKISATDYEGIGFAVPISVAQPVVESLIKYGYVPNRPKLGISYASVSNYWRYSAIVQGKGLPKGSVIIASISDDSAFKNTSVAVGDMITSVNGKKLTKSDILLDVIDKSSVGDELKLGICRIERSSGVGGSYSINEFEVTVKLVEDKGSATTADQEETTTQSFYDYYYGNGNGDNYSNFEDFFSQFFGSGF